MTERRPRARADPEKATHACVRTTYIDPADVIYVPQVSLEYERVCVRTIVHGTDRWTVHADSYPHIRPVPDRHPRRRARMHSCMHSRARVRARRRVIDPRDAPNARPTSRTRRTFFSLSLSRARRRHAHRSRHHDPVVEVRFDDAKRSANRMRACLTRSSFVRS